MFRLTLQRGLGSQEPLFLLVSLLHDLTPPVYIFGSTETVWRAAVTFHSAAAGCCAAALLYCDMYRWHLHSSKMHPRTLTATRELSVRPIYVPDSSVGVLNSPSARAFSPCFWFWRCSFVELSRHCTQTQTFPLSLNSVFVLHHPPG